MDFKNPNLTIESDEYRNGVKWIINNDSECPSSKSITNFDSIKLRNVIQFKDGQASQFINGEMYISRTIEAKENKEIWHLYSKKMKGLRTQQK